MNRFAKSFAWVSCSFGLLLISGCGGESTDQKSTPEEVQSFRADPSKMPADAKKYMQQGQKGAESGQAAGKSSAP